RLCSDLVVVLADIINLLKFLRGIKMEHAGERIKENLEYAKGQAREAFGKVFHQEGSHGESAADEAMAKGKQQTSSTADGAQSTAQQAKEASSK
ncbi:hypothetical protein BGX26_001444, partial [Mortierella sp. AD094]